MYGSKHIKILLILLVFFFSLVHAVQINIIKVIETLKFLVLHLPSWTLANMYTLQLLTPSSITVFHYLTHLDVEH